MRTARWMVVYVDFIFNWSRWSVVRVMIVVRVMVLVRMMEVVRLRVVI